MPASPSAVLFDLDETLTNRRATFPPFRDRFLEHFAEDLERSNPEEILQLLLEADAGGYNMSRSADICRLLPWRRAPTVEAITAFWQDEFPPRTVAQEGLFETLDALSARDLRLGIVTNGPPLVQSRKVDALGVRHRMRVVTISGEVGLSKPDPRIFEHALSGLGSRPGQTWFVGDHPEKDVLGAAAVGMTPVWMRGSQAWPEGTPPPDRSIDRLSELLPLLDASGGGA